MAVITRGNHTAAVWEYIGETRRIRVGVYPDGTARLSLRPTREFSLVSADAQRNPWVVFNDGTPEECREMAEKLETVFMHAVRWVESGRGTMSEPFVFSTSKPPAQSNQAAGADAKPCRWCQLWNAAFSASQLEALKYDIIVGPWIIDSVRCGVALLTLLAQRDPGDCKECRRSAEIHRGEVLGHEQAQWRAAMWQINPSMRFMMRQGEHDAEFSP